jgi:pilus assembly protein CpaE
MRAKVAPARDVPDAGRGATAMLGDRPGFLAFVEDEASETALRGGLTEIADGLQVRRGGVRVATKMLEREPTPRVLLVDISGGEDPVGALDALAAVCTPDVRVLVVGEQSDIGFYRLLTRDLNVTEYLHKPLTRDAVAELFAPHVVGDAKEGSAEASSRGGRVVAVCGVRGGCGATTVAVNLALQLADTSRGHVALLDLHLRGGTAGIMLGVRPGAGLRVALEEPDRVDTLFLDRAAIPIGERLRLIAAEEPLESAPQPSEEGIKRLLTLLRQRFNHVVIDLPMPPGPAERIALTAARHYVMVLGPDVAGIRDMVAARKLLTSAGTPRVMTVLNRAGMPGTLKTKLVQEGLGAPPDVVIPDLPRELPRAANLGRPALRESAALRRALAPLTQEIAAVRAQERTQSSLLGRLLGRGGGR